jgi:hypothetical protein
MTVVSDTIQLEEIIVSKEKLDLDAKRFLLFTESLSVCQIGFWKINTFK